MNKIRNYWKNKKGITLVWGAFFLVLLLMLAGMAIDLGYMYFVKNQLQVAADAAALAGAGKLDRFDTTTVQMGARQEAWKIACRNSAATEPVFLVTDDGRNHDSPTCQAPPASGLNEAANDPSGDIVVGNWDPARSSTPVDLRFLPIPGTPLPPGATINAVKTVPRRTGETSGMPQVSVFLGQVFRMIGANWSLMSASASAVATKPPRASSYVAVGNEFCPLVSNTECNPPTGSTYPNTCNLVTPRHVVASPSSAPYPLKMGWTSLLNRPGSSSEFEDLMCSTSPYQDICPPVPGIWGVPGTSATTFRNYKSLMYDPMFDTANKSCSTADLKCHTSSDTVTGWTVSIPVVDREDPMSAPDPNPVWGYALVHMSAVCAPGGSAGCTSRPTPPNNNRLPGCGPGDSELIIDQISCIQCGTEDGGLKPALVK